MKRTPQNCTLPQLYYDPIYPTTVHHVFIPTSRLASRNATYLGMYTLRISSFGVIAAFRKVKMIFAANCSSPLAGRGIWMLQPVPILCTGPVCPANNVLGRRVGTVAWPVNPCHGRPLDEATMVATVAHSLVTNSRTMYVSSRQNDIPRGSRNSATVLACMLLRADGAATLHVLRHLVPACFNAAVVRAATYKTSGILPPTHAGYTLETDPHAYPSVITLHGPQQLCLPSDGNIRAMVDSCWQDRNHCAVACQTCYASPSDAHRCSFQG